MPKGIFKDPDSRSKKIKDKLRKGAFFLCIICNSEFWRKPSHIKKGDCKFCSKKCYFEWQKGRKKSDEFRKKCSGRKGEINGNWKGGITPYNKGLRTSSNYKIWREFVFQRDDWTCRDCGDRSRKGHIIRVEAHHIKPFATFPELRFDVSNGLTLCKECHDKKPKGKQIYDIPDVQR